MKTIEEIIKQPAVYLHNWKDKIDIISDFEDIYMSSKEYQAEVSPYPNVEAWQDRKNRMRQAIEKYKPINILFASYGTDNYSGDAFVLFEQEGKLYEVNGGHCSCNGLEGLFTPDETTLEALHHRLVNGNLGQDAYSGNEFSNELKNFLGIE